MGLLGVTTHTKKAKKHFVAIIKRCIDPRRFGESEEYFE